MGGGFKGKNFVTFICENARKDLLIRQMSVSRRRGGDNGTYFEENVYSLKILELNQILSINLSNFLYFP